MGALSLGKGAGWLAENNLPLVSVIIPAYNVAPFMAETLESVFTQDFKSYETIVVNDGSPDTADLEAVVQQYSGRLTYLKQQNKGVSSARNSALRIARGEYVAFLDGDDVWLPSKLSEQVKFLRDGGYDLVYSNALFFGESPWSAQTTFMDRSPSNGEVTKESLLDQRCSVLCSTSLARRQAVFEAGLFDEEIKISEDFDLWLRMMTSQARFGYQRLVLAKYRVRSGSLTSNRITYHEAGLSLLDRVKNRDTLTREEREALERTAQKLKVERATEISKLMLLKGEFAGALRILIEVKPITKSWKLSLGRILLRFCPRFLRFVYKTKSLRHRSTADKSSTLQIPDCEL